MRRLILAALALVAAASPAAAQSVAPGLVAFDVWMNGKPVGSHTVRVAETGEGVRADVAIDLAGKVGPFGFRYAHRCTEMWREDALISLSCVDTEGGKERRIAARRVDGALQVETAEGVAPLPAGVLPSSWWRADLVGKTRMFDTRKGEVTPIRVERMGEDVVAVTGGTIAATHYRLKGSSAVDIWYDGEGRWVKMTFKLRGQSFEYRKRSALEGAPSV
jgi:hypothetical protein